MMRVLIVEHDKLVAESSAMVRVLEEIRQVATQRVSVLLTGESGCGKQVAATVLHNLSERRQGPLVRVRCGAAGDCADWLAEADGGTLFLDDVGALSLAGQLELLRVLESAEIRLVAATNENLVGSFNADLYRRIAGRRIAIPPLRDRPEDLAELARRFAAPSVIAADAMAMLLRHRWPGNVRELRTVIAQARLAADGDEIRAQVLEPLLPAANEDLELRQRVKGFERELFAEALRRTDGKKAAAARLLGIDPSNWAYHAKRLKLQ